MQRGGLGTHVLIVQQQAAAGWVARLHGIGNVQLVGENEVGRAVEAAVVVEIEAF